MFLLSIVFGPTPTAWALLFKTQESAEAAFKQMGVHTGWIALEDDFGQCASLKSETLHGFMLEDMEKSKLAQIERGLHQLKTQAKAQEVAGADPQLQRAMRQGHQGSPILSPGLNGRFG
jgi:hypothetical protein